MRPVSPLPLPIHRDEHLAAQRAACASLVRACERAHFELLSDLGEATCPAEVRSGLWAAELLQAILVDWREALTTLETQGNARAEVTAAPTLTIA
jgi:hypothetical protein